MLTTNDCLCSIAAFLEPDDLHALRCVSKETKRLIITHRLKKASIQAAYAKYSKATRMPSGAVRIFTHQGRQKFDLHTVPGRYQTHDMGSIKSPMCLLKEVQEEGADFNRIGGMDYVLVCKNTKEERDAGLRRRILENGVDTLLDADKVTVTDVSYSAANAVTTLRLVVDYPSTGVGEDSGSYCTVVVVYEFSAFNPGTKFKARAYGSKSR